MLERVVGAESGECGGEEESEESEGAGECFHAPISASRMLKFRECDGW
jgi:hypothetical protein